MTNKSMKGKIKCIYGISALHWYPETCLKKIKVPKLVLDLNVLKNYDFIVRYNWDVVLP